MLFICIFYRLIKLHPPTGLPPMRWMLSSVPAAGQSCPASLCSQRLGAVSGIILAGPRVYLSMARDGLLFRWIGKIHPKYRTPHKAIILQAVWSSVLVATGTYRALFTRVIYTEWIFFGLMKIGLFILRRRQGIVRDYKIWGYPVVPAIFIISSFVIVINQIISDPAESMFGLSLVGIGLPVYYFWVKK